MALVKQGKGKIDWTEWTWNPVDGWCKHNCEYCYMKTINKRFDFPEEPQLNFGRLHDRMPKKPSKIFVCSKTDIMGEWIPDHWIQEIIDVTKKNPQHIFQFLTKNPGRYLQFYFPKNCWLGTTWDGLPFTKGNATDLMWAADMDATRFISFEPLLSEPTEGVLYSTKLLDWIIIGADSRRGAKKPPDEWAEMLIDAAREYGTAVWVKDNYGYPERIKEWPEGKGE